MISLVSDIKHRSQEKEVIVPTGYTQKPETRHEPWTMVQLYDGQNYITFSGEDDL